MSTATMTVMERLRAETAAHHARAEGKAIQRDMVAGSIVRERYAAWLGQMLLVHRALERAIDARRSHFAPLAVVTDEQRHSARIEQDLRFYDADVPSIRPSPGAAGLIARIAEADGPTLLGMVYVLEGSMNGNRYIVMALRKGLDLNPGEGDRYLDPYGEHQRPKWAAWKGAVDAEAISPAEADAAVAGAGAMFDGVAAISDDLA